MKENKSNVTLQIPSSIKSDEYYSAVIESVEGMLNELKDNVKVPIDYIRIEDKKTLLNMADSQGISMIFKRLPIERGRQLLNEFPYLVRGKGSSEAIERMAQIYLGVVYSKVVEYDRSDKSYSMELVYGELAGLSDYYLRNLYDAIIYVNPVGRYLKGFTTSIEPMKFKAITKINPSLYIKNQSLLGYETKSLKKLKVSNIKNFVIRPKEVNMKGYSIISGGVINEG